jgi:hypothetical protein
MQRSIQKENLFLIKIISTTVNGNKDHISIKLLLFISVKLL